MRITSLKIKNFRSIEHLEMETLGNFVLIAGANGCGKTTVLDAMRLVKSLYVKDEWHKWWNEFALDINRPTEIVALLRDRTRVASIEAAIQLSDDELNFVCDNAANIFYAIILSQSGLSHQNQPITGDPPITPPAVDPRFIQRLSQRADEMAKELRDEVNVGGQAIVASVVLHAHPPRIETKRSLLGTAFFSCFRPEALGELEFHTSRRIYAREKIGSVRLQIKDRTEERRSRFLYDLENKYRTIKSQLMEEYVSSLLRGMDPTDGPLQTSLKQLFDTFFPGKRFRGIEIDDESKVAFPVELSTGETHDIDELSSGEKEIVYGYLGLRTGTPAQSVILIDEPELHLNPALVQGLVDFYDRHLSQALGAQVWIVTHSDAILRQGVRSTNTAVFHMARAGNGENQVLRIDTQDRVETAVIDLVGDLAAYRPHAKIVLVEGSGPTPFDVALIKRLFPELTERANFVAAGSRSETVRIAKRLQEIVEGSGLAGRVVTVTDRDLPEIDSDGTVAVWPVYEIENFLLEPSLLRRTLKALLREDPLRTDASTREVLKSVARNLVDGLALTRVQRILNEEFRRSMDIGGKTESAVSDLSASAAASQHRITTLDVSEKRIEKLFQETRASFSRTIETDQFLEDFPGKRLLSGFAGKHGLNADVFRNVLLDQAQQIKFRPERLERLLCELLD